MSDSVSPPELLILWSAPRSRSTAFFRMMAERGDFKPVHEPFSYLAEFGYVEIDGSRVTSEADLIERLRTLSGPVFVKDTTDERYPGVLADRRFLTEDAVHTFIIRDPKETIASYYALNSDVELHQIGFEAQYEIFNEVTRLTGKEPVVVAADDLVARPHDVVQAYCAQVGIEFLPEALNWEPDNRSEWAPSDRWHTAAAASTGFGTVEEEDGVDVEAHPVLSKYLSHHLPFYEKLYARRLAV
jgi:Sulfotransferase domain